MMDSPFVYREPDRPEDEHYYPEAIIVFLGLILLGCIVGAAIAIMMWAMLTGTIV
jgi:preprotein translocase subunit Sss1